MNAATIAVSNTKTLKRGLMTQYLTVAEVAKRLRVSRATITRWISNGDFPNARQKNPNLDTSPYEIPLQDVIDFEDRRKKGPKR